MCDNICNDEKREIKYVGNKIKLYEGTEKYMKFINKAKIYERE